MPAVVIMDVDGFASSYTRDGLRLFRLGLSLLFNVWAAARRQPTKDLIGKRLCVAKGISS